MLSKSTAFATRYPPSPLTDPLVCSAGRNTLQGEVTTMVSLSSSETFRLVSGGNSAFSMIIRLAPGMVEEIKRLEAQGGSTRMKFDSNPNNSGNIIDVGGKQFRFTWSQELGDLCDIYEERQSGEDGNGLLVESGSAWRKLNVCRTLDESTKNLVKMRSEEAERKHKSRKAIVLEPGNPSMKALAAAEVAPRKNYNKKKEAVLPKRGRVETLQVGAPPKSAYKPGLSSTTPTMSTGKQFSSLSSPPNQTAASSSPLGDVNISKGIGDVGLSQKIRKQDTNIGSEKGILTTANNATRNMRENKGKNIVEPVDLQSILISLLMNKPDGMTLKALENAVKGIVLSPKKKIKPIMRTIASYKSPGRYILLPEVGLESFRKPLTESGSYPDDNHPQLSAHEEFHDETPAPQGNSKENNTDDAPEELEQLKSKVAELTKTLEDVQMFEATHTSSPIGFTEGTFKNISKEAVNRADNIGSSNVGLQTGYNQTFLGRSATDLTQTGHRSFDLTIFGKSSANSMETSNKQGESSGRIRKHPQKGFRARGGSSMLNDKSHKVSQNEDICVTSEKVSGNAVDDNSGSKQSLSMDSHCVPHGETVGKLSEGRPSTDHIPREYNHNEFLVKKLYEQKKSLEGTLESRNPLSAFVSSGFSDNLESENKKIADIIFKESSRSHSSTMHSHPQHQKANNVEIGSQNLLAEMSGGPISNKFGVTLGIDFEGRSVNNNATGNAFTPNSSEEEAGLASREGLEFADKNNRDQDSREYFLDENSSYLKYEKAEAQLKGPITSFSQYKEYEQEYREMYGSYMFLNKACASYRDEFQALSNAAEAAKGDVDKYNNIRGKIMESYQTYGMKHKRQKKILVILHRELESIKQRITEFVEAQNRAKRTSFT